MSLTEREKEIALACARATGWSDTAHKEVRELLDLFLSSIREEQEAVAWLISGSEIYEDSVAMREELADARIASRNSRGDTKTPLFTTPPAAPCDCSELVEALQKIASCESKIKGDVVDIAQQALASHAKRFQDQPK